MASNFFFNRLHCIRGQSFYKFYPPFLHLIQLISEDIFEALVISENHKIIDKDNASKS